MWLVHTSRPQGVPASKLNDFAPCLPSFGVWTVLAQAAVHSTGRRARHVKGRMSHKDWRTCRHYPDTQLRGANIEHCRCLKGGGSQFNSQSVMLRSRFEGERDHRLLRQVQPLLYSQGRGSKPRTHVSACPAWCLTPFTCIRYAPGLPKAWRETVGLSRTLSASSCPEHGYIKYTGLMSDDRLILS